MFALKHNPVKILQDGSLAIAYRYVIEFYHLLRYWWNRILVLHLDGKRTMFDGEIGLYLDVRYNVQTVQFYYARNEVGHLVNLRQHQYNLHLFLCSERVEQNLNLVSCLSVKTYKRVLDDKHFRLGK